MQIVLTLIYMFSRTGGSNYHTFGDYLIQLSLSAKQFFFCDDKIDVKSIGYGGTQGGEYQKMFRQSVSA